MKLSISYGLTVGVNTRDFKTKRKKRDAYACDITYTTNSELGFDYLRDNMVTEVEDRVMRGLHMAVIDEVDSVLIDESRTPLIISGGKKANRKFIHSIGSFCEDFNCSRIRNR